MTFTINKTLPGGSSFEGTKQKTIDSLREEGFGVLTEIDIQATMKSKLGKDYPPFVILGACNPTYADKVLSIDPNTSVFLPCNVTIRQLASGEIAVSAVDPLAAMGGIGLAEVTPLAEEVFYLLTRAIGKL